MVNSMDLIDRDEAIVALKAAEAITLAFGYHHVLSTIRELPSVQPEIIQCKDCKHWGKRGLCEIWDYYISNEDFYCGCAGRRTE